MSAAALIKSIESNRDVDDAFIGLALSSAAEKKVSVHSNHGTTIAGCRNMNSKIELVERDLTGQELVQMKVGFDDHAMDNGVAIQGADRLGFVAMNGIEFAGCVSGLAYKHHDKHEDEYSGWMFLTDLFVVKRQREQGVGSNLLRAIEGLAQRRGVKHIWTWTAGYEAPSFYQKFGFDIIAELENWYSNGASRFALRKDL